MKITTFATKVLKNIKSAQLTELPSEHLEQELAEVNWLLIKRDFPTCAERILELNKLSNLKQK